METPQSAAYIINIINNKIAFSTNDVKTSFLTMLALLRASTVQAIRNKKHTATSIGFPSILHTTNSIKWARQQLSFRVPNIHSPVPTQDISPQTNNTLSAEELQQIAMVVTQAQFMAAETATMAPIVTPFTFDRRKPFQIQAWCGLKPTQEILKPLVWRQLNV